MTDVVIVTPPPSTLVVSQKSINVVRIIAEGPQGPPGPAGPSGVPYEHNQNTPSSEWIINHNLGRMPAVDLIINNRQGRASVRHDNVNSLAVEFSSPQTGKAVLT